MCHISFSQSLSSSYSAALGPKMGSTGVFKTEDVNKAAEEPPRLPRAFLDTRKGFGA